MSRLTITCVITQILVSQPQYSCPTTEKKIMLKAHIALATGHFFNQLGHVGVVTPPPQKKKKKVTSKNVQVRMWTTGTYVLIKLLAKQTSEAFEVEYLFKLVKS